jgi:hypothetical protein
MDNIKLGDYVYAPYHWDRASDMTLAVNIKGYVKGKVGGIETVHNSFLNITERYTIKTGLGGKDRVYTSPTALSIIADPSEIQEIDTMLSAAKVLTPTELRAAFAKALGVADATGWKTGECIIEELWGKGV